jgi:hypothetical protein
MDQNNENNKGIDLNGTFRGADTSVKFEEYRAIRSYSPVTPKMIQWVMKHSGGLVKDEKQANYVLLAFVVVTVIITLFLIFGGGAGNQKLFTPGAEAPAEQVIPPAD